MLEAILLGAGSQSSLLLAGLLVYWVKFPKKVVGWLAGFGAGALISAVAFDLIAQDQSEGFSGAELALWLLIGAFIFVVGDYLVEKRFGGEGGSGALGIIIGAVVDGIPESLIFGIQLAVGLPISAAFLFAVWVSNIPQALAPSADLAESGWSKGKMALVWGSVVLASGVAAGLGYFLATSFADVGGARLAALASGGILAMLTNSLMPFAFERGGVGAGVMTVVGFAVSLTL